VGGFGQQHGRGSWAARPWLPTTFR
jgi:hypothetical protein